MPALVKKRETWMIRLRGSDWLRRDLLPLELLVPLSTGDRVALCISESSVPSMCLFRDFFVVR